MTDTAVKGRLLVDAEEARQMLGLGRSTFGDLYRSRAIPCVRVGARVVRFSIDDLRDWVATQREAPFGRGVVTAVTPPRPEEKDRDRGPTPPRD